MKNKTISISTLDGHKLDGYLVHPEGTPKGGVIVLQEIFGVTSHIREVTEGFARQGYLTLAPALFDRLKPGIELEYTAIEAGIDLMQKLKLEEVAEDLKATVAALRRELAAIPGAGSKIGAVGYCWGGSIADFAACRTDINAAVAYYGRATVGWLDEQPRCPVLYHFGALDPLIPPELVQQITAGRPGQTVHVYAEAGHGFNCNERHEFHAASAELALQRTLEFFSRHLG
ncbi:MAG: dienelactone hydrolase family protein [Gammaproteobacteria bacterium]|jgi:carboxymethylenebutenolidase|nr:dienelactone hydrolase family protein [Gammaproteobacteria bacterium]